MIGFRISKYINEGKAQSPFDRLYNIFKELLVYTSGDVSEALSWLNEIDKEHKLTDSQYGMGNFIQDLKDKGIIEENRHDGTISITPKTEKEIRQTALEQVFGKLKKGNTGNHKTNKTGKGTENSGELRPYQFGDMPEQISMTDSFKNAIRNHHDDFLALSEDDLEVQETEFQTQTSTVLMIDISHSMILYGEDRITPAKKVAMAMAELIKVRYPKDTLDIIVFGNDAWKIEVKDLPYLQVGPYHTNTVAGLELAIDILRRRKTPNKQIFMITDGKPSCLKEGNGYYQNSFGLDRKIVNKTLNMAAYCKRLKIGVTTFMIAKDPYLQQFIHEFTETCSGKAFYSSLKGLGQFVFEDYAKNKKKRF